MATLCGDEELAVLVGAMRDEGSDYLERIGAAIAKYPEDPRLHFMLGSGLVGAGRLIEAHRELNRAVELAPDFAIARFQLGFFQLTSGEPQNALETWGRLDALPSDHYLRKFVDGLRCLIRDEFGEAVTHLQAGIAVNTENPPMNNDMQLIIDQCMKLAAGPDGEATSEAALILSQSRRGQH